MGFFDFLAENAGSIIALLVLALLAAAVIVLMIRRRKEGKTSCGCDCSFCGKDCQYRK